MTIAELRNSVADVVGRGREADWIVGSVLHVSRSALIANPDAEVGDTAVWRVLARATRRADGQPLQYVTSEAEFCGLPLRVAPDVLIPRPETEEVAERVIAVATEFLDRENTCTVWDVCCGSGAIALAVKHARPEATVVGFDNFSTALSNAVVNGARLGLHATWIKADVLDPTFVELALSAARDRQCNVIVSNPPYIGADESDEVAHDVLAFEPGEALFAPGADPLIFFRRISALALTALVRGGRLIFETHTDRAGDVADLLREADFQDVSVRTDNAGRPRMVEGRRS